MENYDIPKQSFTQINTKFTSPAEMCDQHNSGFYHISGHTMDPRNKFEFGLDCMIISIPLSDY